MTLLKFGIKIIFVYFCSIVLVYADDQIMASVPFQNVLLTPNQTLQANFAFGATPIIFCYENSLQTLGIIIWPYQGNPNASQLPITLVTSGQYQGSLSDPSGVITITNNQNFTLVVNCVYGF